MRNGITLLALAAAASGCIVHAYDSYDDPVLFVEDINMPPVVLDGYAGVYFDSYYYDDVWTFEVTCDDPDSPYDIVGVWADVYDEWRGGRLVDSFELYPTDDPLFWYSDWFGSTTYLDPFYRGYTVDLIAYDRYESFDWITIWVDTY